MSVREVSDPPEVGSHSRSGASVEIYRSVNNRYSWRVVAMAADDSEAALRAAKALALALDDEVYGDLLARQQQRRSGREAAKQ